MRLPGSKVYRQVRGHEKPGFGFWRPDHALSAAEVERAVTGVRRLGGPMAAWNRCQGLAEVAQGVQDRDDRARLLQEAFANADDCQEPNRVVTVGAWPLRALLDTGELEWFERELDRLLRVILAEPNPFRRQDGLYALLFVDAPQLSFDRTLDLFCAACREAQKTQTMRRVAEYVSRAHHAKAVEVCQLIREPRRRRQALRAIGLVFGSPQSP